MCLKINWSVNRPDLGLARELLASGYGLLLPPAAPTPPPPPPPPLATPLEFYEFCLYEDRQKNKGNFTWTRRVNEYTTSLSVKNSKWLK